MSATREWDGVPSGETRTHVCASAQPPPRACQSRQPPGKEISPPSLCMKWMARKTCKVSSWAELPWRNGGARHFCVPHTTIDKEQRPALQVRSTGLCSATQPVFCASQLPIVPPLSFWVSLLSLRDLASEGSWGWLRLKCFWSRWNCPASGYCSKPFSFCLKKWCLFFLDGNCSV